MKVCVTILQDSYRKMLDKLGMEEEAHQVDSGQKGGKGPIPEGWSIMRKAVWKGPVGGSN